MQKFYLSDADATIQKLQNQLREAHNTIDEQHTIISSLQSQIEQLQELISETPSVTYVDYPLCMNYDSIELATQVDWLTLSLFYKNDSGSHFWWLSCGTSQIQYQYDKMWHINKNSSTYFALANFTGVIASHAGSEVSEIHPTLYKSSQFVYTQCYTDTPYLLIPIGLDQARIRALQITAEGPAHYYLASRSELSLSTFPIFLQKVNV